MKTNRVAWLLLTFGALLLLSFYPSAAVAQEDLDDDGLDDAVEDALMAQFAPIVYLHSTDEYRLSNIEWFLERVQLRFNKRCGCGDPDNFLSKGEIMAATDLLADPATGTAWSWDQTSAGPESWQPGCGCCTCNADGGTHRSGPPQESSSDFFLQIPDDDDEEATRVGSPSEDWACYAHVQPAPCHHGGMIDIQYWFFYPYNGPLWGLFGAHEGDFEHITVRVAEDMEHIHGIYYAAHGSEGRWYQSDPSTGFSLEEGRPIVYSAWHSHASYPWTGVWVRGGGLPDDQADGDGPVLDCASITVNLGEKSLPAPGLEWIQFTGRWGEIGASGGDCDLCFSGPHGPAFQSAWTEDPLVGDPPHCAPIVVPPEDQSAEEGIEQIFALGSFSGGLEPYDVEIEWGDGTSDGFTMPTAGALPEMAHTYIDGPTSYPLMVTVTVTDGQALSSSASFQVTVNNVEPIAIIDAIVDNQTGLVIGMDILYSRAKMAFTLSGSITDPGLLDTHVVAIDWGDDSETHPEVADRLFSAPHIYSKKGHYEINITVTDKDGGTGSVSRGLHVLPGLRMGHVRRYRLPQD